MSRTRSVEYIREVQERRRSHAAGKHDPRSRKLRTRRDRNKAAIKDSSE